MSWQEDLQQLDMALAGGQISADDYRRRRDEVLATASGGTAAPAPAAEPAGQTAPPPAAGPQAQPPSQPNEPTPGHDSFPPPFRWQSTVPPVSAAEATQTMRPVGTDSDSTQVVAGTQAADRTQVVPGAPRQQGQFPAQYPPQQGGHAGWSQRQPDTSAPWAGSEFPPLGATGNWALKQGPEVFGSSGSGVRRLMVVLAVVVVLAGLGVGAYFLFFNNHSNSANGGGGGTTHPTTTAPKPRPDPLAIIRLPGRPDDRSGIKAFADVVNNKLLTDGENQRFLSAGATTTRMASSTLPNGLHITVMAVRTTSASDAAAAVTSLVSLQVINGMHTYQGTTPNGVRITEITLPSGSSADRAHYSHGNTLVRVEVYGNDIASVRQTFNQILDNQLSVLSADG
jgi:hypothetical protein